MTITLKIWEFWVICALCLFPTFNKVLDNQTEKLRKRNNELILEIKRKIDEAHK